MFLFITNTVSLLRSDRLSCFATSRETSTSGVKTYDFLLQSKSYSECTERERESEFACVM